MIVYKQRSILALLTFGLLAALFIQLTKASLGFDAIINSRLFLLFLSSSFLLFVLWRTYGLLLSRFYRLDEKTLLSEDLLSFSPLAFLPVERTMELAGILPFIQTSFLILPIISASLLIKAWSLSRLKLEQADGDRVPATRTIVTIAAATAACLFFYFCHQFSIVTAGKEIACVWASSASGTLRVSPDSALAICVKTSRLSVKTSRLSNDERPMMPAILEVTAGDSRSPTAPGKGIYRLDAEALDQEQWIDTTISFAGYGSAETALTISAKPTFWGTLTNPSVLKRLLSTLPWLFPGVNSSYTLVVSPYIYPEKTKMPNICLISIDTFRGDHLSPEYMPKMYKWAKENCIIFTNMRSNSTWTYPSHSTMLTGLRQEEHGVECEDDHLGSETVMIQEQLKSMGYHTYAFTGGGWVRPRMGFGEGFDHFWFKRGHSMLTNLWDPFEASKSAMVGIEQPSFLFLHSYYVHKWCRKVLDPRRKDYDGAFLKRFVDSCDPKTRKWAYTETVQECDTLLFEYIQWLLSTPHGRDMYIIFTSDHGEGLNDKYEDGFESVSHGYPPRPDQIHVPLIVYGFGPGESDDLIATEDITSLIYAMTDRKLYKPKRQYIISEYLDRQRDIENKMRHVTRTTINGWEMVSFADSVKRDESEKIEMPEDVRRQLKALGYLK